MRQYNQFIQKMPEDVLNSVESYIGSQVALFKPRTYVGKVEMYTEDYQIVIPSETPPPTLIGKKEYEFCKNRLIVFNPRTEVYCRQSTDTRQYSAMTIKKQFVSKVAGDMGFDSDVVFSKLENPISYNLRQAINSFQREIEAYGSSYPIVIDSISIQIVAIILRELESNIKINKCVKTSDDCYVNNAKEFMHAFFSSNIFIEDICREIHITPFHFIRIFKEKTGMTPHEYLLAVRIENAKRLIKEHDYPISEIAKQCGFVNSAHFSTTFRRRTGQSPAKFKKNSQC